MDNLERKIENIFIQAEMSGAIVIVEALSDRQIYTQLADKFASQVGVTIYPANYFEECNADNCENVIQAIRILQDGFNEDADNLKHVLGIIDRDSTAYQNPEKWVEINQLKGLLILRYYSIETYFVTSNNLSQVICAFTKAIPTDISATFLAELEKTFKESQEILYYMGLDALMTHCQEGKFFNKWWSNLRFDKMKKGLEVAKKCSCLIFTQDTKQHKAFKKIKKTFGGIEAFNAEHLGRKKNDLDKFAFQNKISASQIKEIVSGKWYLLHYVKTIHEELKKQKHPSIFAYKVKGIDENHLYHQIMNYFDPKEFEDIIKRLKQLKIN